MKRYLIIVALCLGAFLGGQALAADDGGVLRDQARRYWEEKKYGEAAEAYRKLRDEFPQHESVRSGDAQFWLWCSLGNAGKADEQVKEIEGFLKGYPNHRSCAYALYFLGVAYGKMGRGEEARRAWEELLRRYPADKMAEYAKSSLQGRGGREQAPKQAPAKTLGRDFVDGAAGAAEWLKSIAREEDGGLAWSPYEGEKPHTLNFYKGSAGVCLFFLNMYRVTGKEEYADLAKRGAQYLMKRATRSGGGLYWQDEEERGDDPPIRRTQAGLYEGAAGIGYVFLCLHRALGEGVYLDQARGAADWIVATAKGEKGVCHWGEYTDIIAGAAGIGLFLLQMHEATGDRKYLECAVGAAEWLMSQAVRENGFPKWKSSASLNRFYTGFSHGAAGIAYFLAKVYERTGEKRYLKEAAAGADGLMKGAVSDGRGVKWFHYEPGHEKEFMTGWCHGPAGTCRLFLEVHKLTGNAKYLEMAERGGGWLMASLDPSGKGAPFFGLSMCCGAAGVGDFFLDLYLATNDPAYLEYAGRVADYLLDHAKPAGKGCKWTNYDVPDKAGKIYCATGHMLGAAGVGTYFLKLHAVLNNAEDRLIAFADRPCVRIAKEKAEKHSYVVLSSVPDGDAYYGAARRLASAHKGIIVPFNPGRMLALRRDLARIEPRYVAVILKPEEMDVNLQRQMIALSTRMDDDPFCDFAFGFVTGAAGRDALAMVERSLRAQKEGLPKTMVTASVTSGRKSFISPSAGGALAEQLGYVGKGIYWSCVEADPGVLDFVKDHIKEIQRKGVVMITGNGDPEGIWLFSDARNADPSKHWAFDPEKVGRDPRGEMPRITAEYFKGLDLSPAVVWSGTCHSGVLHRAFVENDIASTFGKVDKVTEYIVPEGKSLGLAILSAGPSAYLAPVGPNHGYSCSVELYRAMSTGEPMGEVMRSRYNEIMLDAGGRLDFGLCQPGAPILAENPMRGGGANRTLYGDPLFKPFPKSGRACLRTRASPLPGGAGLRVTCEVADESAPVFWDMFGDDRDNPERIHAVVEVPARPGEIKEVSAVATSPEGKKVTVSACHWAVEKIEGKSFVHLQVNATRNSLAKKGVRVEFTVMNREPAR